MSDEKIGALVNWAADATALAKQKAINELHRAADAGTTIVDRASLLPDGSVLPEPCHIPGLPAAGDTVDPV